ncbi:MAG: pseudouridine synthase [Deltaproteobacteria bacterium]|nr:MAG: pseudouridine synthase [Deltaproteobacteria bacterium]TNF30077.1 MAG: pseudouridine synthase [Deltaproteobacteria bacterium]
MKYIAFYKPYGVLTQFTGEEGDRTLSDFNLPKNVYAAGRLDKDSEGLLVLTDDGAFNQKLTNPKSNKEKTYLVQVENIPTEESLQEMRRGLKIQDYTTKPCKARLIDDPGFEERVPPIRERKSIPTAWLEIIIVEGKNRQVRKMTAKIGHPTLRLIRVAIGKLELGNLKQGEWREVSKSDILN